MQKPKENLVRDLLEPFGEEIDEVQVLISNLECMIHALADRISEIERDLYAGTRP